MPIGNYKKPIETPNAATQRASAAPPTPAKTIVDAVEKGLEKDAADTFEVTEKVITYEDLLKEEGMELEDARKIQDAILIEDLYRETFEITKTVSVTFRTRFYQDIVRYHQTLERYQPKYVSERDEITMRYFLAASLEAFRGQAFSFPHPIKEQEAADAAFQERHDFVLSLPEPTVQRLSGILHTFDKKVRLALSEGAVEFF